MRLGINLGYWGAGNDADNLRLAREAEHLGCSVVLAAEAYGSDAATVLTWVGAHTERIDLLASIFQIPARAPTMAAMTAATLDTLTGGRFRLGFGVSGPQVSEGWYGVGFGAPLERTREYVDVVRLALRRERVNYQGRHYTLPLPDGPGKPLKLIVHPVRDHIPIYLAAIGPKNLELAGEIADGWLSIFFSAEHAEDSLARIRAGRRRAAAEMGDFDIVATAPIVVGEDINACADPIRGYSALYIGGMGSREKNFYNALAKRMGYEREADDIQDKYLAKDYRGAMAAVPLDFIDNTSLLGPVDRIADRMKTYAEAGVTTLSIATYGSTYDERLATLRAAAEALDRSGVGD